MCTIRSWIGSAKEHERNHYAPDDLRSKKMDNLHEEIEKELVVFGRSPVKDKATGTCTSRADSSRILVNRVQSDGCPEAWQKLVEYFLPFVLKYCRRCGVQEFDAHDVAQNVFVEVAKALPSFAYEPSKGRFRSWMMVVTNRQIARFYRREMRVCGRNNGTSCPSWIEKQPGTTAARVNDAIQDGLYERALNNVAARLSADVWTAFVETWINERPAEEVASLLSRPTQWVYRAKSRVLARLRDEVITLAKNEII